MAVKTVQDLINEGVEGRHVLVRADLNVPLKDGEITDPGRIDALSPRSRLYSTPALAWSSLLT